MHLREILAGEGHLPFLQLVGSATRGGDGELEDR
jgi:hypothetical protein